MENYFLNLRTAKAQADGCAKSKHTSLSFRKGLGVGLTCLFLTLGVGQIWGENLYVPGYNGNWSTNANQMTGTSSPWTFSAYWSSAQEFKIHNGTSWIGCTTANPASLTFGTQYTLNTGGGNNMKFSSVPSDGGRYKITVTKSGSTYYITATKEVEEGNTAYNISSSPYIYFNVAAASSTYTSASILLGKSDGSQDYPMSGKITNTQLFYKQMPNWSGFKTFLFIDANNWGGSWNGEKVTQRIGGATNTNSYNTTLSGNYHMFTVASGDDNAALTYTSQTTYSALLNKTQTIQVRVSEDNGSSYSNAAFASWPGSITVARTYMSSATASSTPSAAAMTAATTTGVITSSITFTGANTTEYTFAGWSNSSTSPDGNTATTYTITGATTKYAFYKRKQYTVSYGVNSSTRWGSIKLNSGSAVTTTSSSTLNHGTAISFTATPNSGYQVEGWYSDAACSSNKKLQSGGTSYNAGTLTAAKTVYVKFAVRTGGVVTLNAGTGGQVSLDNSSWATSTTKSNITTATAFNIYARANDGYTFNTWTKNSGSGTITTNAASGKFTPVAYEDATITASFNETKSTITVTANNTSAGSLKFGDTSKSWGQTPSLGVATSQAMTATASSGYVFCNWVLAGAAASASDLTSATITLKADGSGSTGTATAMFYEDYYYRGGKNSWGATKMTPHVDGYYAYYSASSGQHEFKITPNSDNYDYACNTFDNSYGNITLTHVDDGFGGQNVKSPGASAHYICVLYPNTDVNDLSTPVIFASTTLPNLTPETTYSTTFYAGDHGSITVKETAIAANNNAVVQIGSHPRTLTATPASGYLFDHWTTTGNVTVADASSASTTVTASAAGGTVTAVYAEDLTSTYYVEGDASGPFSQGWTANASTMMMKRTGYSTSSDVYWELVVPAEKTSPGDAQWEFKIYNSAGANSNAQYMGWGTDDNYYWLTRANNSLTLSTSGSNNIRFKPYVAGTYTFHVNYSNASSPTLEVIWPTINQLQIYTADPAHAAIIGNYDLEGPASNIYSKSLTLNGGTLYKFKIVYNSDYYGFMTGDPASGDNNYDNPMTVANHTDWRMYDDADGGGDSYLYAIVSGQYTFRFNSDNGGNTTLTVDYPDTRTVTYNANGATSGTVPGVSYHVPNSNVTLAKNTGTLYKEGHAFNGWNTAPGGGGTHYAAGGTLSNITANQVLYAEWVANDYTMYFYNKDSWSPVYAYMWTVDSDDEESDWHGRAMSLYRGSVYEIDYRHDVHSKVIFNNNDSYQTADLTIAAGLTGNHWFYNDEDKDVTTGGIHNGWSQYIMVANFPTSTVTAVVGEKVIISPYVVWAEGIEFYDIDIESTRQTGGSANVNAVISGTNIIVSGTEAGTATFNITYTYSGNTITRPLSVKIMNGLTIQSKVPTDDNHWVYDNIMNIHYWGTGMSDGDVNMTWVKNDGSFNYYQACVPTGTDSKINFLFYYDNYNEAWRKTQDITNVTANGCYWIKHTSGLDAQRNAVRDGDYCSNSWQVQIAMGSGDIFTSNIVEDSEGIVSFFAPSNANEAHSYRQGTVTIEHNGTTVATVPANTFSASGVYTAKIDMTDPVHPALTNVALYTGDYYIRTDGADGGWDHYKDAGKHNKMTNFTRNPNFPNETFSYYWVANVGRDSVTNIKGTVANDYNPVLCNFTPDETAHEADGINLRFGYEPTTNDIVRGILKGSTTEDFLNLIGTTGNVYTTLDCSASDLMNEAYYTDHKSLCKMQDKSNWVYEIIVYAKIDDDHKTANVLLKSYYYGIHYLLGMVKDASGIETSTPVDFPVIRDVTTTTNGKYGLRIVYDFKTNRLFGAWAPSDRVVDGLLNVDADVMFLRHEDGDAAQIGFNTNASKITGLQKAIFALELENEDATHHGTGNIERHYFFSLPFDCNVKDIFGIGGFMNYWGIQRYRGDLRAQKGWFKDTPTFWEWLDQDDVLHAGEGYLISVDKNALGSVWKDGVIYQTQEPVLDENDQPVKTHDGLADSVIWVTHTDGSILTLYFPSTTAGFEIKPATGNDLTLTYPNQPCTITRDDRDQKDSNWKCIGTPGYKNITISGTAPTTSPETPPVWDGNTPPNFLYEFHEQTGGVVYAKGTYTVTNGQSHTYHSFNSYMVQYAGTITWSAYSQGVRPSSAPAHIAARRAKSEETQETNVQIDMLSEDGTFLDRTFVWLRDDATEGFDQNYDLNKMIESKANQIYSLADKDVPFAANVLPTGTDTVELVVNIAKAGEYTFSLPEEQHFGLRPILYDMYKSQLIDLLATDYTVDLTKGKYTGRFFLLFSPVQPIATDIETTEDGGQKVLSGEGIYDVLGRRVNTVYPGHLYIVNGEKRIVK